MAVTFVGSKGDSYDNAMAETLNSLFKAECIRNPVMRAQRAWKNVGDVEIAVAEYVDWFNHRRLHGETGHVPSAEYEQGPGPASRPPITLRSRSSPRPEPSNRTSTKPGAIQCDWHRPQGL